MNLEASDFVEYYATSSSWVEAAVVGFVVGALLAAIEAIFQSNIPQTSSVDLSKREVVPCQDLISNSHTETAG